MSATDMADNDLLGQFTREQSQDAFTELVNRHLNLVYTAAFRQVRSSQLAEEVSQTVFLGLAREAAKLRRDTLLTAWLYTVTHRTSVDVVRREARRQAREQIAIQLSDMNAPDAPWAQIEPMLDEAMNSLEDTDRAAILLRYFENKSLREVGQALGTSEDAAQKRVTRAVERLRDFFTHHRVTVGTAGLIAMVSANAIQAAPVGLGAAISATASLASTAITTSTVATLTQTIAMTTLQKAAITAVVAVAIGTGIYQTYQSSVLREQVKTLEKQKKDQQALAEQAQRERDRITNKVAALSGENANLKKMPTEALKLRGEVGRLRQENAAMGSTSALNKITANPETKKMLRDQQKVGMKAAYKSFVDRLKLPADQADKLNELLADHIMDNVDNVTTILRDKLTAEQMNELFAGQDTVLAQKIQDLIGADGLTQYQDYTHNLIATLSGDQFKAMLTGGDKEEKAQQIQDAILAATQSALASAGLPADYQTIPMLNFRNIASEAQGEQSLKLMDDIYAQAAAKAASFLTADELAKFAEFRKAAINSSRMALTMNRTMMAPLGK